MLFLTVVAMFTMFEIFGRTEKRFNIERLKRFHKANGVIYILLFGVISYLCLDFIIKTKAEPSARAAFHGVFALTAIILLGLKITFVRIYKQYYAKVQTIGLLIALITMGMIGTSSGYYLMVTKFGIDKIPERTVEVKKEAGEIKISIRTDSGSISKGRELYESKCYFCHDAYSTNKIVGPGHKGILKNSVLPVSKRPSTPENVANQIRNPYRDMPSFSYLSNDEVQNIIAFLNTL
jgi:hypothetical protein